VREVGEERERARRLKWPAAGAVLGALVRMRRWHVRPGAQLRPREHDREKSGSHGARLREGHNCTCWLWMLLLLAPLLPHMR
jgi:hypothetical protein